MNNNLADRHPWISGSELYRARLIAFNYHPAAWARSERLKPLCPMADADRLRQNPRAERFLSRFILSTWKLDEPYTFDFEPAADRLVLMSVDALEQLAERMGLLCFSDVIRLSVRRDERARLVESLGESRRQYAVSGATRYGSELKALAASVPSWNAAELTVEVVRSVGWRCVLDCVRVPSLGARKRFELKLPPGVEIDGSGGGDKSTVWPLVERVLKSEFRGEWQACCC